MALAMALGVVHSSRKRMRPWQCAQTVTSMANT
jgi:hypothetical protein